LACLGARFEIFLLNKTQYIMTISNINELIKGKTITFGKNEEDYRVCFASDLMSDVLRIDTDNLMLLTGLANMQAIRTAEMADISCIILARGKKATNEMIELAEENEITIIESPYSMFHIAGILYNNEIKPLF
jgi:predicted transcriptional regulator